MVYLYNGIVCGNEKAHGVDSCYDINVPSSFGVKRKRNHHYMTASFMMV